MRSVKKYNNLSYGAILILLLNVKMKQQIFIWAKIKKCSILWKKKEMFDFMEEKGFYTNKDSGEGPFLIIFNDSYMKECNRITLVLPKDIDTSKFARELFDWLKSII
jgi:hypothetical protein